MTQRERVDFIMRTFSDGLASGHHEALDWLVSGLDPAGMDTVDICAVLTCARWPAIDDSIDGGFLRRLLIGDAPVGDLIPARHGFLERARTVLIQREGADRTENLLKGLER